MKREFVWDKSVSENTLQKRIFQSFPELSENYHKQIFNFVLWVTTEGVKERLLSRSTITNTCWLWNGSVREHGYGATSYRGKQILAHRLSYELFKGPIPRGLVIDHLCGVKRCLNPEHLEPVTVSENTRRYNKKVYPAANGFCYKGHRKDQIYKRGTTCELRCRTCYRAYRIRWNNKKLSRKQLNTRSPSRRTSVLHF